MSLPALPSLNITTMIMNRDTHIKCAYKGYKLLGTSQNNPLAVCAGCDYRLKIGIFHIYIFYFIELHTNLFTVHFMSNLMDF